MPITAIISKTPLTQLTGQTTVGVIGLGYVGLPLALCFVEKGFRTIGFDIDQSKVDSLRAGAGDLGLTQVRIRKRVREFSHRSRRDYSYRRRLIEARPATKKDKPQGMIQLAASLERVDTDKKLADIDSPWIEKRKGAEPLLTSKPIGGIRSRFAPMIDNKGYKKK